MNGYSNDTSRLPGWLKKRSPISENVHAIKLKLRNRSLHTVCEEAKCPNLGECFARGTATFMIMGDVCTRRCGFCAVKNGMAGPLDKDEPKRVALQIRDLALKHAVITSVTRDDLPDGGAGHFAETIREIKGLNPDTTIEVLTPDFEGREIDVKTVCAAGPNIFNHNIETVERLTAEVRSKASYHRSLGILRGVYLERSRKAQNDSMLVKSGLMLGLGETPREIEQTLKDLKDAGCNIVTIGQYLRPSKDALPVKEYLEPKYFKYYEEKALKIGFKFVFSGPFVRSSYMAEKAVILSASEGSHGGQDG